MLRIKKRSVIPGFGLSMGYTLVYLSLLVLIPLGAMCLKTSTMTWHHFWETVSNPRALAAYKLTLGASLAGAIINVIFGVLVAWVLVRYRFPGRRFIDGLVDLPFALPTAVAGIALTDVYSQNGWIGHLLEPHGIKVAYAPPGIVMALTFIGLPFVVRTVQPILEDVDVELEDAAYCLGANRFQTFSRVIFPVLLPAILTGFALSFARALGEYGSVVFISGNMPFRTEIVPLLIMTKLEQYDYTGATAIAVVMLAASFVILLSINGVQWWSNRRYGRA